MVRMNRVSLSRKKELEKPDEFLTFAQKALAKVLEYERQIMIGLVAVIVLLIAYAGIRYHSEKVGNKAFVLLNQGMSKYAAAVKADGPEKGRESVEADFNEILEKYSGTVAGKIARVNFANICYTAGDYEKAITLYQEALGYYDKKHDFRNMILSGLGYSFEGKKDFRKSITYFEMIASGDNVVMKDEALYNMGRLYEQMGEKENSQNAYKRLISEYKDSMYIEVARESISG